MSRLFNRPPTPMPSVEGVLIIDLAFLLKYPGVLEFQNLGFFKIHVLVGVDYIDSKNLTEIQSLFFFHCLSVQYHPEVNGQFPSLHKPERENHFVLSDSDIATKLAISHELEYVPLNLQNRGNINNKEGVFDFGRVFDSLPCDQKIVISLDLDDTVFFREGNNYIFNMLLLNLLKTNAEAWRKQQRIVEYVITTSRKSSKVVNEYSCAHDDSTENLLGRESTLRNAIDLLQKLRELGITDQTAIQVFHAGYDGSSDGKYNFLAEKFPRSPVFHFDDNPNIIGHFSDIAKTADRAGAPLHIVPVFNPFSVCEYQLRQWHSQLQSMIITSYPNSSGR